MADQIPTKVVRAYIAKNPDVPNLTAAKILYKKHPELWKNVEAVRLNIRTVKGLAGEQLRRRE